MLRLDQFGAQSADVSAVINVAGENEQQFDPPLTLIEPVEKYPQSLALRYYDLARDYQVGVQQSERGSAGRTARQIELPAVLTASDARRIVEMQRAALMRHLVAIARAARLEALQAEILAENVAMLKVFETSCTTGAGIAAWCDWLKAQARRLQ